MPWMGCSAMDERLRFVARVLKGETTDLCRKFGISRKTGYKISTHRVHGLEALADQSRRPVRYANQLPAVPRRVMLPGCRALSTCLRWHAPVPR